MVEDLGHNAKEGQSPYAMHSQVAHWAAHYEHCIKLGSKPIVHLEAFVCKFMHLYRMAMSM
jgi:hypothetical protein